MDRRSSGTWRRQGDAFASDPGQWEFHARVLFSGAEACWQGHLAAHEQLLRGETQPNSRDLILILPAHFLAAMGVDVLLKALALQRDPDLASRGDYPFYTHRLDEIAKRLTGVTFSAEELSLLRRLSALVEWAGRYPIPKWNAEKHREKYDVPVRSVDGTETIHADDVPGAVSYDTWKHTTALIHKLQQLFATRSARA